MDFEDNVEFQKIIGFMESCKDEFRNDLTTLRRKHLRWHAELKEMVSKFLEETPDISKKDVQKIEEKMDCLKAFSNDLFFNLPAQFLEEMYSFVEKKERSE